MQVSKQDSVLIIDDDQILCHVFKDILENSGYKTFTAQKREEIFNILSQEKIDLIYMDVEMPELNSIDLARQIKETSPLIMIVLISGYPQKVVEEDLKIKIGEGGIDKFIDKGDLFDVARVTTELLSLKDHDRLSP